MLLVEVDYCSLCSISSIEIKYAREDTSDRLQRA
jgi:hypothetical protein